MIKVRPLDREDVSRGLIETLGYLAGVSLDEMDARLTTHQRTFGWSGFMQTFVAVEYGDRQEERVVGTATVFIEKKLIHSGGKAAHIEDVVVHKDFQGLGIGRRLVQECIDFAKTRRCYKAVLSCTDDNVEFYAKLGFRKHEVSMRIDL